MAFPGLIPKYKTLERLQFENPWWVNGQIPAIYHQMARRLYFARFYPFVAEEEVRRAVVLMGPRRVGKTVMMFHAIHRLLETGTDAQKVFFVGIDNPIYIHLSLQDILDLCKEAVKAEDLQGCYVFFDEIQYLKDWERHLKVLVDQYPATKFIVSGSAAAALRLHSSESGAGRFTDFMLPPLTFQEYIHLKNLSHLIKPGRVTYNGKEIPYKVTTDIKVLNREFIKYLNFGGYPEVVLSEKIQDDMARYVKSGIVDKVLLRDLPSLYGIKDVQELNRFFTYLAYHTGKEFSFEKLSKESGIQKDTLKKYLEYLEAAFLIKILNKIDASAHRLKRVSSFKVFLTNPSLRTALFSPLVETDEEVGNVVETTILAQWMHRENMDITYARWKDGRKEGEVDIVLINTKFKPAWAVEIKWTNRYFDKPNELRSLFHFCTLNNLNAALVTTLDAVGDKQVAGINLAFLPASLYAYNIGAITLEMKG